MMTSHVKDLLVWLLTERGREGGGGGSCFQESTLPEKKGDSVLHCKPMSFSRYELHLGIRRAWHFMAPFPLQLGNGTIRDTRRETGNEHDWHRALGSHRIFPLLQEDISEDLNDN